MRNHGWQPPFHPLQTVAIAVFCALAFSFYVFFAPFLGTETLKFVTIGLFTALVSAVSLLYIACTWIDPADPGVHRSHEKYHPKIEPEAGSGSTSEGGNNKSIKTILEDPEEEHEPSTEKSRLALLAQKSCCQEPGQKSPDGDSTGLYCSICDADISSRSKHCRACDKCVHGFDHHCRWLNNCVGTRNYRPFVALMVTCLLMLILEWAVGVVVLVRCFRDETEFDQEIVDKLGSRFPRVAFIAVLIFLTFLALAATAPLTQLFCFHLILMQKGITTYDYILAVREENQEFLEETGTTTTSPATSTDTVFSGYNSHSSAGGRRIVFCTPPRMFVDQDQTIMALSDLEVGVGKPGGGRIIDSKSQQQKPAAVGLNPFKLARVTTEDAARAAARARAKSSILLPNRPGTELAIVDSPESGSGLQSSSGSEIRLADSRRGGRRKRNLPGLPKELKQNRISPLGDEDADTPNLDSSLESLPPLPLEPRSPYRDHGHPRASIPPPRFTRPEESSTQRSSSTEPIRISVNSDGYEASCGESGDETCEPVGLSESWTQESWKKASRDPQEQNNNSWVASFNVKESPGGKSVSSTGSRVEANVLKANPELQRARLHSSSPTVYEDSPLPSDFMTDDATTSAGETPDRGTSTYFYGVPSSEPGSSRRITNVAFAPRGGISRAAGDP